MSREDSVGSSDSYRFAPPGRVAYSDALGRRRTFGGLGYLEWGFICVSTLNIAATLGLTIERIVKYSNKPDSADFTFALLLLVNAVFCLFYIYNGILREQTFEIVAFIGGVILVLGYCISEYVFNVSGRNYIKLGRLVASCVLAPINVFLGCKVALQFGWLEFRIVGASEALQYMYRQQRAFFSLLKFDLQAAISFVILILEHGIVLIKKQDTIILSAGISFSFAWLLLGWCAVKTENKGMSWLFGVLGILEPVYIFGKISMTYLNKGSPDFDMPSIIFYSLLGVGSIALIVRCILMVEVVLVYKNFNNGLGDSEPLIIAS